MAITDEMVSKELDSTEKLNALEKHKTESKKAQFINEVKNGLGKEIKANPRAVKIIKKPWEIRVKMFLKKIFTKF